MKKYTGKEFIQLVPQGVHKHVRIHFTFIDQHTTCDVYVLKNKIYLADADMVFSGSITLQFR